MLAIFITHAEAQKVEKPRFRALSCLGRTQVDEMANRFRDIFKDKILDLNFPPFPIGEIISSPLARCVETTLRFATAINDLTTTSEIRVRDRLREKRDGQLFAGDLVSVLDDTRSQAVLICTHGDLAGALPLGAKINSAYINDKGWFIGDVRPVLALVQYERGSKWNDANVLCCESKVNNNWEDLLVK